jgi:hypothetical protein
MADQFPPTRESELLSFSANFDTLITATPTAFGLVAGQAVAYNALHTAFESALDAATKPSTRTKPKITAKDVAKEALVDGPGGLRELAAIIQAFPGTSDEERENFGLPVRDTEPTPVPAPTIPPVMSIERQLGRSVTVRLRDAENPDRRGKPDGVIGASVFMFVGDDPPANPMNATFLFNTSKNVFDIDFPAEIVSGAKVWLTAFWFNRKQDSSNAAAFMCIRVGEQMAQAA